MGGLKMQQDTISIPPNYCTVDDNWSFYENEVIKRPGLTAINASAIGSSSTHIMGAYRFKLEDATTYQMACTSAKIYSIHSGVATDESDSDFTGGDTDLFTFCTANDEMIATNGIDNIRRWNGVTATVTSISGSSAPSAAKYVESYVDRIFAARTTESSVIYHRRLRWSNNASNILWNGTSAGFTDLNDTPGWITGLRKLKEALIVYKDDSIVVGVPTGIASAPVSFNQKASVHGCISGQTIADFGDVHIYLGRDNVYMFDLVESVPIGDDIRDELFSTSDFEQLQYAHAQIKDDRREYWLWVTPTGGTTPTRAWCYNWKNRAWSRHTYPTGIICSGQYAISDTITIDDLSGTIDEQGWRFNDRTTLAATPFLAIGAANGMLYYINTAVTSDDGATITASLETPDIDFGRPGYMTTVTRASVIVHNVGSTNLKLAYSMDGGSSFTETTATYTPGVSRYSYAIFDIIGTAENFRFRIKHDQSAGCAWNTLIIDYIERGRVF